MTQGRSKTNVTRKACPQLASFALDSEYRRCVLNYEGRAEALAVRLTVMFRKLDYHIEASIGAERCPIRSPQKLRSTSHYYGPVSGVSDATLTVAG